jgi:hypothetical protein
MRHLFGEPSRMLTSAATYLENSAFVSKDAL